MSSVDERITYCLEEIDSNFVKAIDIVSSMTRSIKTIASNMREMDAHSRAWFTLFNTCEAPPKPVAESRDSIGTLILTDDENTEGLAKPIDTDEVPSFLQEDSEAYLKYMSPPRTTKVYKPLNTPGGDRDTSAMDTSSSSYYGYSPPMTPLLKRRKPEEIARESMQGSVRESMQGSIQGLAQQPTQQPTQSPSLNARKMEESCSVCNKHNRILQCKCIN